MNEHTETEIDRARRILIDTSSAMSPKKRLEEFEELLYWAERRNIQGITLTTEDLSWMLSRIKELTRALEETLGH